MHSCEDDHVSNRLQKTITGCTFTCINDKLQKMQHFLLHFASFRIVVKVTAAKQC